MYEASSAEAAPSIIATANAPPRNQCLRCRVFASIFSNGTTGRAESSVRSSSNCGFDTRSGEFVALSNLFFIVSLPGQNCREVWPIGFLCNHEATPNTASLGRDLPVEERKWCTVCHEKAQMHKTIANPLCDFCALLWLKATIVEDVDTLFHAVVDAVSVEPVLRQQ